MQRFNYIKVLIAFTLLITAFKVHALDKDSLIKDTLIMLKEVEIRAFDSELPLEHTPVPITVIDEVQLNNANNGSILSAINMVPGVKMESRGLGGSRRISIRGSLLRSPFGVRNISVFLYGVPITDADGSTPFELADPFLLDRIEVVKGPSSSLYGSGMGGVIFLDDSLNTKNMRLTTELGSQGYTKIHFGSGFQSGKFKMSYDYIYQRHRGWREQES
ncbi:MAG: Plug domain-containing protein, partial [Bacteroidetes bacterium]|nr:Plug domain-containing protein [Bacteroidota bacterium]